MSLEDDEIALLRGVFEGRYALGLIEHVDDKGTRHVFIFRTMPDDSYEIIGRLLSSAERKRYSHIQPKPEKTKSKATRKLRLVVDNTRKKP